MKDKFLIWLGSKFVGMGIGKRFCSNDAKLTILPKTFDDAQRYLNFMRDFYGKNGRCESYMDTVFVNLK